MVSVVVIAFLVSGSHCTITVLPSRTKPFSPAKTAGACVSETRLNGGGTIRPTASASATRSHFDQDLSGMRFWCRDLDRFGPIPRIR